MRGDIVYRVYGQHEGRETDVFFEAFSTVLEADAEIAKLCARETSGRSWAEQYHNRGFVIRETIVETDFEIPPLPKPRDKYVVQASPQVHEAGIVSTLVTVLRRTSSTGNLTKVCEYQRNYPALLQTFEHSRQ